MMIDRIDKDALWVMLRQEQKTYKTVHQNVVRRFSLASDTLHLKNGDGCDQPVPQYETRADCRYNMVDWCYRMVDFCGLNRETAAIAMNFVDRFVVTNKGQLYLTNNTLYQLVVVTALYTAVKIHEIKAIDLQSISSLSKGSYSVKQIEEVEREIIDALQWRMNPPTAQAFVRGLIELIHQQYKLPTHLKETIIGLSRVQTEFAVFDQDLMNCSMSTIGYCSLMNAFTAINHNHTVVKHLTSILAQTLQIDINDNDQLAQVQSKLCFLLSKHHKKNKASPVCGTFFPKSGVEANAAPDIQNLCPCVLQHTKESTRGY